MPYGKYEYHFGRVSQLKDDQGHKVPNTYRVGPVTPYNKYKGARPATFDHVIRMLEKVKGFSVTLSIYGHWYPNRPMFEWLGFKQEREDLIKQLKDAQLRMESMEQAVYNIFNLLNVPPLILAWEATGNE
jgi:hypothetical protein